MTRRITAVLVVVGALVLCGTAFGVGTWRGALTVVGSGATPGSVTAHGWEDEGRYCVYGEPQGSATVDANTLGAVTVTVAPSSQDCYSMKLFAGTYDIRWQPGTWDPATQTGSACADGTDIGDVTVDASGYGGPTVSQPFDPGGPGTIQVCVANPQRTFGIQVPVSVAAPAAPTTTLAPGDVCPPGSPRAGAPIPALSDQRFGHIMNTHGYDTAVPPAGRFGLEVDMPEDVEELVRTAFCYGTEEPNDSGEGGYNYRYGFQQDIGEAGPSGARQPTKRIHVTVIDGAVRTAYPIL